MALAVVFSAPVPVEAASGAEPPVRVVFMSPDPLAQYPFWADYVGFMRAAAKSLDIELTVVESSGRFDVVENVKRVLAGPQKPDYLMYIYHAQMTPLVLDLAEKAGVSSFVVNTDVFPSERQRAGRPREMFSRWIGHVLPDDELASQQLAETMIQRGWKGNCEARDGRMHLLGFGGNREGTSSTYRERGLLKAANTNPKVVLDRFLLANWSRSIAYDKMLILHSLHPEARVCWAAGDGIALGVIDAIKASGKVPGKDILVGGIDWSAEGLAAIRRGEMEVSFGGHFMNGAWTLILLLDYHNGIDFGEQDPVVKMEMRPIDRNSLKRYGAALNPANWSKIDFKRFSKTYNPGLAEYAFSPDLVVRALAGR